MAVPDFQSLMLPALKALADGAETPLSEVRARVRAGEGLTDKDVQEMLPGGRQSTFVNRVSWGGHLHGARRSRGTGSPRRLPAGA